LNLRLGTSGVGVNGVLSDAQDARDDVNFSADDVAGFNVNTIAIEVPISMLTSDGNMHSAQDVEATVGIWATTSHPQVKVLSRRPEERRSPQGHLSKSSLWATH
jgi:hypothetical protein